MNQENIVSPKEEFDRLFEELAGVSVEEAERNPEGWLFIPKEADLGNRGDQRDRLEELAGSDGWKNNLTDDEYDGWWIRPLE